MTNKKKLKWDKLDYKEMIRALDKLSGPRPGVPGDLPKLDWSPQALRVLQERYFAKDKDGTIVEDVPQMCWRVAWESARSELKYGKSLEEVKNQAKKYYRMMITREFLPNSPTLMNAGKGNGLQYSACYVLPVEDSLEGIFDGVKYQAIVHQSGGGTGFSFSRLRPAGSRVKSTMGVASGPVSFMRVYNEATQQIKQGGMRRGANMGILRVDHPDILNFIHCKEDGGITNFNISVAVTDRFMEALAKGEEYELIAPHNKEEVGTLLASHVWDEIAKGAWKTGDPGVIFIDRINQGTGNPIRKEGWVIESTNPCVTGDTIVYTSEGLKRIDELAELGSGQILLDTRLSQDRSFSDPARIFRTGVKSVYELQTFEGYGLKLTGDHKVLTTKGWKQALELKEGDELFISSRKGGFGKAGTEEEGQILGWLVGDGTMKATSAVLSFFGGEKQELAPRFAQMVGRLVDGTQFVSRNYTVGVINVGGRNEARVQSERLWRYAFENGIKPGDKLKVPEKVFGGSEAIQRGFLQALFTADGHAAGNPDKGLSVRLTSISESLLEDVQKILLNFGIACAIYRDRRVESDRLLPDGHGSYKEYRCKAYHDLVISKENVVAFAREIGFLFAYKNQRIIDWLKSLSRGPYREKFIARFKNLIFLGKEAVYDLTEPLTHSFVANGLVVHNCGEQQLYPFDACNLGSIFLSYFVKDGEVDWKKLKTTVHTAVRLLDSVIEVNPFPLPQIAETVKKIRRIGLGVGGWADMLVRLGMPYDSQEALDLAEKVMKFVNDEGHKASEELARERGAFPLWKDSIYRTIGPIRNSTVTTIAPTGSIGILANASSGIEPKFAIAYQHIVKSEGRTLNFVDELFEEQAKSRGIWSEELKEDISKAGTLHAVDGIPEELKRIWVTAHEVAPSWHVKMQAAFQKYTDNAVSKTINLANSASVGDIQDAYMLAWETGCNGITVFRDGCKTEQVLNLGVKKAGEETSPKAADEIKEPVKERPMKVSGATYRLNTPVGSAFVTINQDEGGEPLELFINVGKAGSDVAAMAEALGRTISTSLRFRGSLTPRQRAVEIAHQLAGIGGRRSVGFGANRVLSLPDAVAMALSMHFAFKTNGNGVYTNGHAYTNGHVSELDQKEEMVKEAQNESEEAPAGISAIASHPDICPACGEAALVFEEGCKKCYSCGHSEC